MTSQLAETFNLPELDQLITDQEAEFAALSVVDDKIETITDLSESNHEMDELAKKAMDTFDDMMDLGMNVEQRHAAPIFEVAAKMLGHAILAKSTKIDRKLKAMDLEMKRQKMIQSKSQEDDEVSMSGDAKVLDRNDLLKIINTGREG